VWSETSTALSRDDVATIAAMLIGDHPDYPEDGHHDPENYG
jgi:hypothetical protein